MSVNGHRKDSTKHALTEEEDKGSITQLNRVANHANTVDAWLRGRPVRTRRVSATRNDTPPS